MVMVENPPRFTEPTPLSDILDLFRYRRVEVSASGALPAKKLWRHNCLVRPTDLEWPPLDIVACGRARV